MFLTPLLFDCQVKLSSLHARQVAHHEASRGISTSSLDGMLVHRKVTVIITNKFAGTHLYTKNSLVWREAL